MTAPVSENQFLNSSTKRPSYADKVSDGVWIDQYGRAYSANMCKNSGHPSGPCLPENWTPPHPSLIPPLKYHRYGRRRDGRVFIDLDAWRSDYARDWAAWRQERSGIATKEYKDAAAAAIETENPILMDMVGPSPLHPSFLDAMLPMDASGRPVPTKTATAADWGRANNWVLGRPNRRGERDPQPAWATAAVMKTLQKREAAVSADLPPSLAEFANPDDDGDDYPDETADTVARLDGAARYESLDDDSPRETLRTNTGQFKKKSG